LDDVRPRVSICHRLFVKYVWRLITL